MLPDRISRLLTAYVDGELTERQREAVSRLLDRSSEARELLHSLQNDAEQLRSLPRQGLHPEFSQRILQTIANGKLQAGHRSLARLPLYVPIGLSLATAAAVLLLIGFASYLYIATVDREHKARIAIANRQSTVPPAEPSVGEPAVNVSAARKPEESRERLGAPALQSEAKAAPSSVVSRSEDEKPLAGAKEDVLASPVRPEATPLKHADALVPLPLALQDLDQATAKHELQQRLQKAAAYRIDLRCTDTRTGLQRLHKALESHGVRCIVDQDAGAFLELGIGKNIPVALYFEEITADEIVAVLQQLGGEDRKAEGRRRGKSLFDILVVNALTPEEQQRVPRELGIDSAQLDTPMPKEQVRADSRKPLSTIGPREVPGRLKGQGGASAEKEAVRRLTGQGGASTKSGQPVVERLDRQVLVVAYTPGRPRRTSVELQRFLDARKERRAGTVQILLLLTPTK